MNVAIRVKATPPPKKKSLFQQVTFSNSGIAGFDTVSNYRLSSKIQGLFNPLFGNEHRTPATKFIYYP
jgi:hypothetical protein